MAGKRLDTRLSPDPFTYLHIEPASLSPDMIKQAMCLWGTEHSPSGCEGNGNACMALIHAARFAEFAIDVWSFISVRVDGGAVEDGSWSAREHPRHLPVIVSDGSSSTSYALST